MTKRTCHFHDGCVWPEHYGDELLCYCKRLKIGDFHEHRPPHIAELLYQAVRRAILPQLPRPRDTNGRFISRRDLTTSRLKAETEDYFTRMREVRG